MIELRGESEHRVWRDALLSSLQRMRAVDAVTEADAAVMALRARLPDPNGPTLCRARKKDQGLTTVCDLPHGHPGNHQGGEALARRDWA